MGESFFLEKTARPDYKQAYKYYKKAAEYSHKLAEFRLGLIYLEGVVGPKDRNKAIQWFEKSAQQGLLESQFNLVVLLWHEGKNDEEIQRAFYWAEQLMKQDDIYGYYATGRMLLSGEGTKYNPKLGIKRLEHAAKKGEYKAANELSLLYKNGQLHVNKSLNKSYQWAEFSAKAGNARGQLLLSSLLLDWELPFFNVAKGKEWLSKAADGGNEIAIEWLEKITDKEKALAK
ncbi:sel1 repeat family protein [Psychrobium sp. MM17-31]|uniref:tetratricopeptide repeat protein n=1 Tax=Psychrobium sp. MM17-31 TaxID=2917758 RepID=UPI001EF5FD63|nr:tetratricopeptide repeat protein [Psychrobium sp. MM17-31]MCG7531648.1 sel1 repeat family protein [Psychrobium sp. MM17-31]